MYLGIYANILNWKLLLFIAYVLPMGLYNGDEDGIVRVTIDMRQANKAIKSSNIPIPQAEDIKAQLSVCQVFSKLDFKSTFHQLKLSKESRGITVFHGLGKLMRHKTLTMGSCPASGELTKALGPLFQSIPQAHVIHDDLIIAAKSQNEHDEALGKVLDVISKSGMTLKIDKCILSTDKIPFWGIIVTKDGLKPIRRKLRH